MSKIRECFTSRFKDGILIEVDFEQLEVAALAFLSQDTNLMDDIEQQLDMHLVSLSWVTGQPYEKLKKAYDAGDPIVHRQRKLAKRPRFELQYGAGARTIAKNNDWPLAKAVSYIENYYKRYRDVYTWQNDVANTVLSNKEPYKKWVGKGDKEWISYYICPHTARRYVFYSYENKYQALNQKFSSTQMKNYPVQGFATGDLVPTVLGELALNLLHHNEDIKLINTVHDSVLLDVRKESFDDCLDIIEYLFSNTDKIMEEAFNCDLNVPIRYSIEFGSNWSNMKRYNI